MKALQILEKARQDLEKRISEVDKRLTEALDTISGLEPELARLQSEQDQIAEAETTLQATKVLP